MQNTQGLFQGLALAAALTAYIAAARMLRSPHRALVSGPADRLPPPGEAWSLGGIRRAFLYGLGLHLGLLACGGLVEFLRYATHAGGALSRIQQVEAGTGIVLVLVLAPLSFHAFLAARRSPPHRSHLHAVAGWLAGFFAITVGVFAVVGSITVVGSLAR
jgi:hypothetical protein